MASSMTVAELVYASELLESPPCRGNRPRTPYKGHRSGNTFRKLPKGSREHDEGMYVHEGQRSHRAALKHLKNSRTERSSKHLDRCRAAKKDYHDWAVCDLVDTIGPPKRPRRKTSDVFDLQRLKAVLMRSTSSEDSELSSRGEDEYVSPRLRRGGAALISEADSFEALSNMASDLYNMPEYKSPNRIRKRHANLKWRTGNTLRRGANKYGDPQGVLRYSASFERSKSTPDDDHQGKTKVHRKHEPGLRRRNSGTGHELRFAKVFTKELPKVTSKASGGGRARRISAKMQGGAKRDRARRQRHERRKAVHSLVGMEQHCPPMQPQY
eukprot:scaffold375_cov378-Prasinococcus_capsulatus_cf.AAC.25